MVSKLAVVVSAALLGAAWWRHKKNQDEVTDAFGLGITVGREFKTMRDGDSSNG